LQIEDVSRLRKQKNDNIKEGNSSPKLHPIAAFSHWTSYASVLALSNHSRKHAACYCDVTGVAGQVEVWQKQHKVRKVKDAEDKKRADGWLVVAVMHSSSAIGRHAGLRSEYERGYFQTRGGFAALPQKTYRAIEARQSQAPLQPVARKRKRFRIDS